MAALAATEGRLLGGRPPYGFMLAEAGPHPNPAKAANGQRLWILARDPIAAPVVERIFAEFLSGVGLQRIAHGLTKKGIACPSQHDPARNSHRLQRDGSWDKSAVRAILRNPRYTGHQVWNKQRKDEILVDVENVALGHNTKMRWNSPTEWIWSQDIVHDPIISIETFATAQTMFDARKRTASRTPTKARRYLLSGIIWCGLCERRMQGQWNHDRPYYRCKASGGQVAEVDHPRSVYVKEESITSGLDSWIATLFDDEHLEDTCEVLARVSEQDGDSQQREAALRNQLRKCDNRMTQYRLALDHAGETATIAQWITEVERERNALRSQLGREVAADRLTKADVRTLVEQLQDMTRILATAADDDRTALDKELGVALTYYPEGRVRVQALPRGVQVRVGGPRTAKFTGDCCHGLRRRSSSHKSARAGNLCVWRTMNWTRSSGPS
jgi:site-specific DNA recombinase